MQKELLQTYKNLLTFVHNHPAVQRIQLLLLCPTSWYWSLTSCAFMHKLLSLKSGRFQEQEGHEFGTQTMLKFL